MVNLEASAGLLRHDAIGPFAAASTMSPVQREHEKTLVFARVFA
jgi:hypothetical protein